MNTVCSVSHMVSCSLPYRDTNNHYNLYKGMVCMHVAVQLKIGWWKSYVIFLSGYKVGLEIYFWGGRWGNNKKNYLKKRKKNTKK